MTGAFDYFIHSRCCNAHWELLVGSDTGKARLVCEKCGKEAGESVKVMLGFKVDGCDVCKRQAPDKLAAKGGENRKLSQHEMIDFIIAESHEAEEEFLDIFTGLFGGVVKFDGESGLYSWEEGGDKNAG
jgi:hypothetical protein